MGEKGEVKLFGMWASPFSLRVEWALKLKGIDYEYINEDIPHNKSQELLHFNPITKKIPLLLHHGKALPESTVIVEYIDEAWPNGFRIMPHDPFQRAQARFWARFAEEKCLPCIFNVYSNTNEELKKAIKELQEVLKTLEKALNGKKFFGGETVGYLDIIVGWIPFWLRMIEELAGVTIAGDETLPLMNAWFDNFMEVEIIKNTLPNKDELYAFNKGHREQVLSGHLTHD